MWLWWQGRSIFGAVVSLYPAQGESSSVHDTPFAGADFFSITTRTDTGQPVLAEAERGAEESCGRSLPDELMASQAQASPSAAEAQSCGTLG